MNLGSCGLDEVLVVSLQLTAVPEEISFLCPAPFAIQPA